MFKERGMEGWYEWCDNSMKSQHFAYVFGVKTTILWLIPAYLVINPEICNYYAFWWFLVIFSNFISFYMHKLFNTKTLLFAGWILERFEKHTVLGCTRSSTPGGTYHLEVGRRSYERRKIQKRRWDPQGTFWAEDLRWGFGLRQRIQKAQIS